MTPGPWEWDFNGLKAGERFVLALDDDGACGDPDCCGAPTYHIVASEADRTLIAAAPELLAAVKLTVAHIEDSSPKLPQRFYELEKLLRTTIEKAAGEA